MSSCRATNAKDGKALARRALAEFDVEYFEVSVAIVESCGLCPACGWVTVYGTPAKVTVGSDSGPAQPKDGQR